MNTVINAAMVVAAEGGVIDEATSLVGDIKSLFIAVVGAGAIAYILTTLFQKRTLTAVLVAAGVAGIVYWLVALDGIATVGDMFEKQFSDEASVVHVVDPPQAPGVVVL